MILPEALFLAGRQGPLRYPTEFQQRRVTTIGGAATTVAHVAFSGFTDRHLILNTLWVNWVMQPNATTATRMAEINLQLVEKANGSVLTFNGLRDTRGLVPTNGQVALDLVAGGPQTSAAWNLLEPGTWVPAGYDLRVEVIARNAIPISNDLVTAVTGFTIELGGINR